MYPLLILQYEQFSPLATSGDDFKENVQKDGWFMAGAWSMKLIRVQDAINGAAHNLPVGGQATMEYGDIFDNSLNAIMAKVAQDMAKSTTASRYANGIDAAKPNRSQYQW